MSDRLFGIIYKSTILEPESSFYNKIYIGKHVCESIDIFNKQKYVGCGRYIKGIVNKYGKDNIKTEPICLMFNDNIQTKKEKNIQLGELEKHFIKLYDSQNQKIGLNISSGGDGGDLFSCRNEELQNITRQKLSKSNKGRIHWWRIGKKDSEETKKLRASKHVGMKRSEESKILMRKSKLNGRHPNSEESKLKGNKKWTEETKNKKIEFWKEYYKTHPGHAKGKKYLNRMVKKIQIKNCVKCNMQFETKAHNSKYCNKCKGVIK